MQPYPEADKIREFIDAAQSIVIVQADNPDTDSLASALALEQILSELGKTAVLYCGVDLPTYLQYLPGWDRVERDLPHQFDASIIIDTSSNSLLEKLEARGQKAWLKSRPSLVIDHHATETTIEYATIVLNHPAVASGEIIYELAVQLGWPLNLAAKNLLAAAILSDSLGLMSEATTARSIQVIAALVEGGVKLAELEQIRRETIRRDPELVHYKGLLLQRVEFHHDDRIATVTIPWEEIERYSPFYNPSMLVIDDMRLARGTDVAIAFKLYSDGKITAKIRTNYGFGIADKLAEHFDGGGHPYAAGFKIQSGRHFEEVKQETIEAASQLLAEIKRAKK